MVDHCTEISYVFCLCPKVEACRAACVAADAIVVGRRRRGGQWTDLADDGRATSEGQGAAWARLRVTIHISNAHLICTLYRVPNAG